MKLNLRTLTRALGEFFGKNASKIFLGAAVGGVAVTAISAGKAAVKAHDKIIETQLREDRELTTKEKARIVAPIMLKPAISGVLTGASVIALYKNEHRHAVTYAGLYALSEATVDSLQAALVDKMGEEAAQNFRNDILKKRVQEEQIEEKEEPKRTTQFIFTSDDYQYYKDTVYGGELMKYRPSDIRAIENEFNNKLNREDYGSVNDLREIERSYNRAGSGPEPLGAGDDFGFCVRQGLFEFILLAPEYDEFGRLYIPLKYNRAASADFLCL